MVSLPGLRRALAVVDNLATRSDEPVTAVVGSHEPKLRIMTDASAAPLYPAQDPFAPANTDTEWTDIIDPLQNNGVLYDEPDLRYSLDGLELRVHYDPSHPDFTITGEEFEALVRNMLEDLESETDVISPGAGFVSAPAEE